MARRPREQSVARCAGELGERALGKDVPGGDCASGLDSGRAVIVARNEACSGRSLRVIHTRKVEASAGSNIDKTQYIGLLQGTRLCVFVVLAGCGGDSVVGPAPGGSLPAEACARSSLCADFELQTSTGVLRGYDACRAGLGADAIQWTLPRTLECVRTAADCAAVLACVRVAADVTSCDPAWPVCEGDVLRDCFAGLPIADDCAQEGLTCIDNGNLACGRVEVCDRSHCEGDRLFVCAGGKQLVVQDCNPGTCHVGADGSGRCLPSLETCVPGSGHCDGDLAVRCIDGYVVRTPCLPGQCRETDGAFCFQEETCVSRCDGTKLLACADNGIVQAIDCAQWGSSGCVDEGGARCAPF